MTKSERKPQNRKTSAKYLRFINERIIDPESRYRSISILYMLFACLMLMHHIYVTIYFAINLNGAPTFSTLWMIFGLISIILGRMWKDKTFWILVVLLSVKFFRVALTDANLIQHTSNVYFLCIYAFFGCYSIGRVFSEKDRKTFISLFCALWTIAVTVLFLIGLCTAWLGKDIYLLGDKPSRLMYGRLAPVYHPVEGGVIASASIAVAVVAMSISRSRIIKSLYVCAILVFLVGGALTVTRMSIIINSLVFSALICCYLSGKIKKTKKFGQSKLLYAIAIPAAFILFFSALTIMQNKIIPGFNMLRNQKGLIIHNAFAEASVSTDSAIIERKLVINNGLDTLSNGRITTWKSAYLAIKENPRLLLWGQSVYYPMTPIDSVREAHGWYKVYHMHNTMIQTLVENGIPGFLLFFSFFIVFLKKGISVFKDKSIPNWERLLPLPAAVCWLADMVDCTAYVDFGKPPMTILYVFIGLTMVTSDQVVYKRKPKRKPS